MKHRLIRRTVVALAATALPITSLATGNHASATTEPASSAPAPQEIDATVAFISPQKAGDSGPIDDMVAALERLETDYGVETQFIEVTDPSAYEGTLRSVAQAGTEYIVTAFPGMQQPVQSLAPEFPDTTFVLIFGDAFDPPVDNAVAVSYEIYQAMYLSGVAAANVSESGQLGYIGGAPQPTLNANYHAFVEGAQSVDPEIEVSGAFVGSFEDTAKARDIAAAMIDDGVDIIQTDAAGASLGVIKAADDSGILVIADSSGAVAAQYPDTVLGTTFLRFGDSLYLEVSKALEGGFEPGPVSSGLADGIVGLAVSEAFLGNGSPAADTLAGLQPTVDQLVEDIASGALTVAFDPSDI